APKKTAVADGERYFELGHAAGDGYCAWHSLSQILDPKKPSGREFMERHRTDPAFIETHEVLFEQDSVYRTGLVIENMMYEEALNNRKVEYQTALANWKVANETFEAREAEAKVEQMRKDTADRENKKLRDLEAQARASIRREGRWKAR